MRISDEVKRLARAGVDKKIYAIYVLRKESGIDLVLAKGIVETIAAGGEVQLAAPSPEPQSAQTSEQRVRRQFEALRVAGRTGGVDPECTAMKTCSASSRARTATIAEYWQRHRTAFFS
jgi:hypothetical protein